MTEVTEDVKAPQIFKSMPNFRGLWSLPENDIIKNGVPVPTRTDALNGSTIKIYRSSRPDFLTVDEVEQFRELDIRCIIDFRSTSEYKEAVGNKRLDTLYPVYKVKLPLTHHYRPGETVRLVPIKHVAGHSEDHLVSGQGTRNGGVIADEHIRKHVLINFFTMSYIWAVFNRAAWYIKLYSLLHLLVDMLLRNGKKYFVRVFARNVINKDGLVGTYQTMLDYSQKSLCAALKLLAEPENVPAMLNCALGKDRTGVVSALVLACLGKSKEYIAQDYARSEELLEPYRVRMHKDMVERMHMCPTFTLAQYDTMMKTLEYIDDKYGSITEYLERIGFTVSDQLQLRANLSD